MSAESWVSALMKASRGGNFARKLIREGDLRWGTLVGQDSLGNKYYENPKYISGHNRFVEYANGYDHDASQIPAEWHNWMTHMSDDAPSKVQYEHQPKWEAPHSLNYTGTPREYVPYSTRTQKVSSWDHTKA
eukprot:Nk52_evm1s549 gene=Nk52_evmTU1s549